MLIHHNPSKLEYNEVVTTYTIQRKTLLYKSGVEYADYCLNHVEGCAHGCKYPCYAFLMKKRCGVVKTYEEWCHPKIVSNALELLEKEIPRLKHKIGYVHLCFSTDPFMYKHSEVIELSLKIIYKLNRNGIPVTTLTKGTIPGELSKYNEGSSVDNGYGITLVSLDENFRKEYEPHSAPFYKRIKALEDLHKSGCTTYVSMEPYPTPNLIESSISLKSNCKNQGRQDLRELLDAVGFVDKIIFGRMNYNKRVSQFKEYREYYNELAKFVINYCKKREIQWHIKEGTITE